jgi:hypothetical protein
MAYGMNTASDISTYIQIIFEDALFVARDNSLMQPLVRSFNDRQGNETRKNSIYGTAIINQVAETDDLVSQTFNPSVIATLTPAEYAGQYFITDTRMESDPFGARQDATVELGVAMAQSIENNLIGNFTSLTAALRVRS